MLNEVIEYLNTHTKEEVEETINKINKKLMSSKRKIEIEIEENDTVEIKVNGEVTKTITPEYKSVNDFWEPKDGEVIYTVSEGDSIVLTREPAIRTIVKKGLAFQTKEKLQQWLEKQALIYEINKFIHEWYRDDKRERIKFRDEYYFHLRLDQYKKIICCGSYYLYQGSINFGSYPCGNDAVNHFGDRLKILFE